MSNKSYSLAVILTVVAILMFLFSFAIAPFYKKFCRITGINEALTEKAFFQKENLLRPITLQLLATNNAGLTWEFFPRQKSVVLHPNQIMTIYFHVKNTSNHTMTVQAIPSFTPIVSARYFHKIECFCFRQQTLLAGQTKEMPVVFRIDNDLPTAIHTITLSYTLFDVSKRKTA